jgi:CheY-like chemotaxis protein
VNSHVAIDWFDKLPMAVAVIRLSDQVVVAANRRATDLFGIPISQLGTTTLWDVVAEVDWNELSALATVGAREGRGILDGYAWEDSTVGLITFKGPNKTQFVSWVMATAIYDEDGIVRHRAALILNEAMKGDFNSLDERTSDVVIRNYYSDVLSNSAHEINNSLMAVTEIVRNLALSEKDSDVLDRALSRMREVGDLMVKLGDKSLLKVDSGFGKPESTISPNQKGLRVLIVDDGLDLLEILANLLTTSGYAVTTASNLKDAQEICKSQLFDVALIDIQLGDDIGIVLAQQLLKDSPTTKVILMTGFSRHIKKYQDLAGVALLRKPFPMYDLLETIQKSLNRTS